MTDLEEEICQSYTTAIRSFTEKDMSKYREKWLQRPKDLDILVNSKDRAIRICVVAVRRDKDLDKLVNDPDHWVRLNVARQRRPEDEKKLSKDRCFRVQQEAIANGGEEFRMRENIIYLDKRKVQYNSARGEGFQMTFSGLEKLSDDPDWLQRARVAQRLGYPKFLDEWVRDPDWRVRKAVAMTGKKKYLDILENDKSEVVRAEVALQRQFWKEISF